MNKKLKRILNVIIYIVFIISIISHIIINKESLSNNKTKILKEMNENTQITDLNKNIEQLNASHTEYANYIQTSKANLAQAITNAGVVTNSNADIETMITNISNIFTSRTSDATATAEDIIEGKTAYVNGELVIGNRLNSIISDITLPQIQLGAYNDGTNTVAYSNYYLPISGYNNAKITINKNHYGGLYIYDDIGNSLYTYTSRGTTSYTINLDVSEKQYLRFYNSPTGSGYANVYLNITLTI